jgi:hypothetical protein
MKKDAKVSQIFSKLIEFLPNVISFIAGFVAAIFAEPVRERLFRSKLGLEFNKDYTCVTTTYMANSSKKVADAHTIRVKVNNTRSIISKDCRGYLIDVEKQNEKCEFAPTVYCDSLPLAWSCQGSKDCFGGIDIPKGVNQYLNVIATNSTSTNFDPQVMPKLFRYEKLFSETGTFRFTILVTAANAKPKKIKLILNWKGNWNDFDVISGKSPNPSI